MDRINFDLYFNLFMMKKTLLSFSLICFTLSAFAQTKFIRVETAVGGTLMDFTLYKKQADSSFQSVETGTVNTGTYLFDSLTSGIYRVHVDPRYNKYLPTWHPRKELWENASDINLNNVDSFLSNEGLLPNPSAMGPCSISGTLTEGLLKAQGDPLKNVRVLLYNNSVLIKMLNTNDSGKFNATSLPVGTYRIRTDIVNATDPSPRSVTVDSTNTSASVAITVNQSGSVNTGLTSAHQIPFHVYPNPAQDVLYIAQEGVFTASLYDIHGKLVVKTSGTNEAHMDIVHLNKGIYIIIVNKEGINQSGKIIIR